LYFTPLTTRAQPDKLRRSTWEFKTKSQQKNKCQALMSVLLRKEGFLYARKTHRKQRVLKNIRKGFWKKNLIPFQN
jgi:hypothetical protein